MGTKQNPGTYDCLGKLAPDEPFFVLRAQDKSAARLVRKWAEDKIGNGITPPEKIDEALRLAAAMMAWPGRKVPD